MGDDPAIRRILVAVDASPLSLAALAAAVGFAGRLGAELEALFVEDINVVRLVAHPYVHTFSLAAARRQALDDVLIEKMLELQAVAARRALDEAMAATTVRGSFVIRRGRVEAELLAAAAAFDLVCLGWSGRAEPGSRPRLGGVARAVLSRAPGPVLVLREPAAGPVMALWDGTAAAGRALAVAILLAADDCGCVDLLIPEADPARLDELAAEAHRRAAPAGVAVRLRAAGKLARCLAAAAADGVLVAAADLPVDDLPCSLVAVR
jgi:nucleotide-binding universal stress UspA family protein